MKSPTNRYLSKIALLVGEQESDRAIQVFVSGQRAAGESLEVLAQRRGVEGIIEERLPFEGGLFQLPNGRLVIKLNALSSAARKRFTLAHEIAHLLVGAVPGFRKAHGSDAALERVCDSIAAELLMPSEEARQFVRGLGAPTPEKLQSIASKYFVSLQAAAVRVHSDFKLWKCCVARWERDTEVKTSWFVGKRRWDRVEPDSYSFELALSSNHSVQTNELWPRGPFTDQVSLRLLRIGDNTLLGLVGFVT